MNSELPLFETIVSVLQEMKSTDILSMDFSEVENMVFNQFIIASGGSSTHVKSISDKLTRATRKIGHTPQVEGFTNASWIAIDYGEIVVHIFQPEYRERYKLEHLWEECPVAQFESIRLKH